MDPAKNVSIVVTIKDDALALKELINALKQQTLLPGEVVFVVAQSSDETLQVAQDWKPERIKVKVIWSPESTRSSGRNQGVEEANSDIIVFTDAGCLPQVDWLEKLVAPFSKTEVELVSGLTRGLAETPFEQAQIPFVLTQPWKVEPSPLPATRNMAIRREVFLSHGGFRADLNYAEDFEFSRRLRNSGVEAVYVPEAIVFWRPRPDVTAFFNMIRRLSAGDLVAGIIRPGLISMWGRYLVLLLLLLVAPPLMWLIYAFYLIFKVSRFHLSGTTAYLTAACLQVICDLAVLTGSLQGLLWKRRVG